MPSSTPKACRCGGLILGGQCNKCKGNSEGRENSNSRGYDWQWRKYSEQFRIENPYCVHCKRQGRVRKGNQVDHIREVSGPKDKLFWPRENHQNLCTACHRIKTEAEQSGRYDHTQDLREAKEREDG